MKNPYTSPAIDLMKCIPLVAMATTSGDPQEYEKDNESEIQF